MTEILMREGHQAGIDLIGVTDAEDIECVPWTYPEKEEHYFPCRASWIKENTYSPKKIMAEAKAVIVTAMYMYGYDKIKESIKAFSEQISVHGHVDMLRREIMQQVG